MQRKFSSTLLIISCFILAAILSSPIKLSAQSVAGKWRDLQYNVILELTAQGAYSLQYPNGRSTGRYGINGNIFWMQDVSGTAPVYYTIMQFNGNLLVLRDTNNLMLNYQRQPAQNQPSLPNRTQATPAQTAASGRVLATKSGQTLTSSHIDTGIDLIQFIIGNSIKPVEEKELEANSIVEFNINPGYFLKEMDSLAQSLRTIRTLTDPLRIGLTRQQLFVALYQATYQMNEADKPLMIKVMNRHIKVLAHDPANNLVLTDKDAAGMMKYLAFNSELMGQPVKMTEALQQSMRSEMIKNFYVLPLEQKQLLCSASLIWQLLEANWDRIIPSQKEQFKAAFQAQLAQHFQSHTNSYPALATDQSRSTSEMMREYRARKHMMSMMNDMNMNTHALSLNIIENIGGTGNYWSVVDY